MAAEYKLLACEVLHKEIDYLMQKLTLGDRFDTEWFEMGLHEKPEQLNKELRKRIAACRGQGYKAILLLFGLCSRATADLEPPPDSKLVIPKVHDCISLYLGSARRYFEEHAAEAGTYWFSRGFLHRENSERSEFSGLGAGMIFNGEDGQPMDIEETRRSFIKQYGEENAEYLMETLIESWKKNYRRAVYLEWDSNPDAETDRKHVANYAAKNNWLFETMPTDFRLLQALLTGEWPEDEFVVVNPGQKLVATNAQDALRAESL